MSLSFPSRVFDDTRILLTLDPSIAQDFLSLSLSNLSSLPAPPKTYSRAASSLSLTPSQVQSSIEALSALFLFATKKGWNDTQFTQAVAELQFPAPLSSSILSVYTSQRAELRYSLQAGESTLEHYEDLSWRVDVEIGNSALRHMNESIYVCELSTSNRGVGETEYSEDEKKKHLFEADFATMKHVEEVLEQAIKEVNTKQAKKILRYVK